MSSFVTAHSDPDDEEDAENDMVVPLAHWHTPAGSSNPTTRSASTTQPGGKSNPDRATEGTTALGSSIGGSVDSGGSAAGALPEQGTETSSNEKVVTVVKPYSDEV